MKSLSDYIKGDSRVTVIRHVKGSGTPAISITIRPADTDFNKFVWAIFLGSNNRNEKNRKRILKWLKKNGCSKAADYYENNESYLFLNQLLPGEYVEDNDRMYFAEKWGYLQIPSDMQSPNYETMVAVVDEKDW